MSPLETWQFLHDCLEVMDSSSRFSFGLEKWRFIPPPQTFVAGGEPSFEKDPKKIFRALRARLILKNFSRASRAVYTRFLNFARVGDLDEDFAQISIV